MKDFLAYLLKSYYGIDITQPLNCPPCPEPVVTPKTNREKLYEFSLKYYGIDPTPKDEVDDEISCVFSLTTILSKYFNDFPIMDYTPKLLEYIKKDKRFKETKEWKAGNIIISPTNSGSARLIGHTGIIGEKGVIYSNSSSTGLWSDKFDTISWIKRYSQQGGLDMYIFELL